MVFPVVMYGCESWTVKKAEHRKIDAFELWCWRRLLRVPWTARKSNQSILKEISPGCSLEGLMLKLKFQYILELPSCVNNLSAYQQMNVHKETCACTHMLKRTHGGILFSHKREGILPFLTTQINLDGIKLNEIRQPQKKQILYDLINMWNLKMSKSYKQKAE